MEQAEITRLYTEVNKLRKQANDILILLGNLTQEKPKAGQKSVSDVNTVRPPSMRKRIK